MGTYIYIYIYDRNYHYSLRNNPEERSSHIGDLLQFVS